MSTPAPQSSLDEQIALWRNYLGRRQAIHAVDVAELEDHLRELVGSLTAAGLSGDEAFLVAVKRLGNLDSLSREFAREHSERLWKQLVLAPDDDAVAAPVAARTEGFVAFGLAIVAALLVRLPTLFGVAFDDPNAAFYIRNASFFVLPLLTGFFAWKRGLSAATIRGLAAGMLAGLAIINAYPFAENGHTLALAALHLPIALWLLVGMAYAGSRWREVAGRMDFIRFSGELFIYFVLLALGGGVLMGFMAISFELIGIDIEPVFEWVMPSGAAGGVLVAAWLVEAKQSVIENMAPVLTRLFTPFFALVLVAFLVTLMVTGRGINVEREALIAFDVLLLIVLALVLYSLSARDPQAPPGVFDVVTIVLISSALIADAFALSAIAGRITEFGFSPNRAAGLGMNVVLLVNLAWSAVLYLRFVRGRGPFAALERWQTAYLPVYAAWAAIVVVVFPPLFRFI